MIEKLLTPEEERKKKGIKKESWYALREQFLGRRELGRKLSRSKRWLRELYGLDYRGRTGHKGGGTWHCKCGLNKLHKQLRLPTSW